MLVALTPTHLSVAAMAVSYIFHGETKSVSERGELSIGEYCYIKFGKKQDL